MLNQHWNAATLQLFFTDLPVSEWLNAAAPRVKSGEIIPTNFDEKTALLPMINNTLLLRRPLIDVFGELACGFDNPLVKSLLGENTDISNLLSCPNME